MGKDKDRSMASALAEKPGAGAAGDGTTAEALEAAQAQITALEADIAAAQEKARIAEEESARRLGQIDELGNFILERHPQYITEGDGATGAAKRIIEALSAQLATAMKAGKVALPEPPPPPQKIRLFRAVKDGFWGAHAQGIHKVKAGKVFDNRFYDIERIRGCGVELEEITPK
jgi:hypothetical protein